jgi:hypothetical protein
LGGDKLFLNKVQFLSKNIGIVFIRHRTGMHPIQRLERRSSFTYLTFYEYIRAYVLQTSLYMFSISKKIINDSRNHRLFKIVQNPRRWDVNPILHTAWLDNHALTLKSSSAKYFYEKSRFLHTFLKFCCESRKI